MAAPPTEPHEVRADAAEPAEPVVSDRRRRWLKIAARIRRYFRRFGKAILAVVLLIVLAVTFVAQTGRGQELAVRAALDRVRAHVSGPLQVSGVRSGTLLTGATLTDVRLDASDGRPFLRADSIVFRYSLLSSVSGASPLRSTTIWGLDLEISRYKPEQAMNIARLLVQGSPDSVRTTSDRPFGLGRVGIREGTVRILTPASAESNAPPAEGPEGERLKELRFDSLDLDVEEGVLAPSRGVTFQGRLASFSSSISVLPEPIVVREAFGAVTVGDLGIEISDAAFRLPGTLLRGDLTVGPVVPGASWSFRSSFVSDEWGDLADLQWIDPRIPDGRFRGGADVATPGDVIVDMHDLRIELEASDVVFDGRARFGDRLVMQNLEVSASPVTLDRIEPWMERSFPLEGWLSGRAVFDGSFEDLTTSGRVTLVPTGLGGQPTTADFAGTVHTGVNPGATDLHVRFDPLNYTVLSSIEPDLPWGGQGSATVDLDGRTDDGLEIVSDLVHVSDAAPLTSRAGVRGLLWRGADDGTWVTDLDIELRPLSVGVFASQAPEMGLRGTIEGSLEVEGRIRELAVRGTLLADGGSVDLDGSVDLTDLAADYRLGAVADSLPLGSISARIPDRTTWSGRLDLSGSGFGLDSMSSSATLVARASRIGSLRVDTLSAGIRVAGGVLITDSLIGTLSGIDVSGRGRLGLVSGRWGSSTIDFEGPSLVGLRPLVMGLSDSVMVRDGLSELDRDFLRLQGIEPDTLPSEADVRLEGAVTGSASISGELGDLDVGVILDVFDGRYKQNAVDTVRVGFSATGLPATTGEWQIGASAIGIQWDQRHFDRGGFEADMLELGGEGRIELVRRPGEQYRAVGSFALDSVGGEVALTDASIQIDEDVWNLTTGGRVAWDPTGVVVDSVEVRRTDADPMYLLVDGTLNRGGESDFRVLVQGLHVEQLRHVAQAEDLPVGGRVELDLAVRGPSEAPRIESDFRIDGPRYGAVQLTRVEGSVEYADRNLTFVLDGWDGVRAALTASGDVPVDLGLVPMEDRSVAAPMDIRIASDSLDAAVALSYLSSLEEVIGTVSGEVWISGTPAAPEPEGVVTLTDAEWSIEAIGVRHTGVNGELRMRPDRTVEVALQARGAGTSEVTGTVHLAPFSDPPLDLTFTFDGFQAVYRSDVEGLISGEFDLTGTYRRPVARGALTVDEGTIYVDELQRAAGVVDLGAPLLFEDLLAVDTTALVGQPLLAGLRNPFFDNLRVDVDLSVPRDTWLRSIDTNIEMTGDLLVRYDRSAADFVLIGELAAVRGSHRVLGRTFEIDGGNVGFIGRPGLNPDLDIQATTRIRRPEDAPLEVAAQVGGTLVQPVVTLSAEEAGLAEEDLVSYLIFGQPSGSLGTRQGAALGRVSGAGAAAAFVQGGVTYLGGAFANQFGSAIARELSLDYVSIQQGGGVQTPASDYVGDTQVELGRYVGQDLFVVMVLRPFDASPQDQNNVAGLRVEWALTDDYNVEGFLEDRFLRSGSAVLGRSGLLENERIWGVFLFRDWGYGSEDVP